MQQQEIQFFWSLTEQIPLDLDFSPCEEYEKKKREEYARNSVFSFGNSEYVVTGASTVSMIPTLPTFTSLHIRAEPESVGYWEMGSAKLQLHREIRPSWFNRVMTKLFFGWKWKDTK